MGIQPLSSRQIWRGGGRRGERSWANHFCKNISQQESIAVGSIPPACRQNPVVFQVLCLEGGYGLDLSTFGHTHPYGQTLPMDIPIEVDIPTPWTYPPSWKGPGSRDTHPPCTDRLTDTCENITFPQLRWSEVKKMVGKRNYDDISFLHSILPDFWIPYSALCLDAN